MGITQRTLDATPPLQRVQIHGNDDSRIHHENSGEGAQMTTLTLGGVVQMGTVGLSGGAGARYSRVPGVTVSMLATVLRAWVVLAEILR